MDTLKEIRRAGFNVELVDDGIEISPARALTQQQREFIKQHKSDIVEGLKAEQRIFEWLSSIGADGEEINDTITRCRSDLGAREYFLSKAAGLKRGNVIPFPVKKGFTRCYTPAGNPIDIESASPEHADWLEKMNPKQDLIHE
jgi:hypothetical protein